MEKPTGHSIISTPQAEPDTAAPSDRLGRFVFLRGEKHHRGTGIYSILAFAMNIWVEAGS
jgi:hypothetical protein